MFHMKSRAAIAAVLSAGVVLGGCAAEETGETENASVDIPAIKTIETAKDVVKAAGKGGAKCDENTTLAYVGAQTGPNAQLGVNIYNGIQQAIDEHNGANPDCQVKFIKSDTEGDPSKATGPVTQITNNEDVIGVVGLPFSGESKATGNIFEQAGLVHITPSATNPDLTNNGWTTFFRGLGNDSVQGPAAAKFLTGKLGAEKVYLIQDDSDYGIGIAKATAAELGDALAGTEKIISKTTDFGASVSKIVGAKPDAVFFAGYYAEAGPFVKQLRDKGFKGLIVAPDGVKDQEFVKAAGNAAEGVYFTCPCLPGDLITDFAKDYEKISGGDKPGTYSVEGYDATTILLAGIQAGKTTREDLKAWVKDYEGTGYSKKFKFDDKGELKAPAVHGYRVDNGAIVPVGEI